MPGMYQNVKIKDFALNFLSLLQILSRYNESNINVISHEWSALVKNFSSSTHHGTGFILRCWP